METKQTVQTVTTSETKTETKRDKTVRLISGNVNNCLNSLDMIEKRLNKSYDWKQDDYSNIEFALLEALNRIQLSHEKLLKGENKTVAKARFTL